MRGLLDTHSFVWMNDDDPRLSPAARRFIEEPSTELFLSTASIWELAIKVARGRLRLPLPITDYVPSRMRIQSLRPLEVGVAHAVRVGTLPALHGDPFDRMLVAQAIEEGMPILTADPYIARYDVATIW